MDSSEVMALEVIIVGISGYLFYLSRKTAYNSERLAALEAISTFKKEALDKLTTKIDKIQSEIGEIRECLAKKS